MSCVNTLKERGLKLTPQRRLIADIIHDTKTHITAEDIIAHVQSKMPGVNKSTIYRTLEVLEEEKCVFKSKTGDVTIYHHAEDGHHHHLLCINCGKAIGVEENLIAPLERLIKEKYGFHVDLKHIVMNGLCAHCQNKAE